MSKQIVSADRVYNMIVRLAEGDSPFNVQLDEPALRKALRNKYLRPARFSESRYHLRPYITAYAVTEDGKDFLHRVGLP